MKFKYQYRYMLAGISGVGTYSLIQYDEDKLDEVDERGDFDYISGTLYTNEKQHFNSPHTVSGYFQEDALDEEPKWIKVTIGMASSKNCAWVEEVDMLF